MDQQVKINQNHYIKEAPIRNKHVFAAFRSFLATVSLVKNNIKGHFCEQMGKLHMPNIPQYKVWSKQLSVSMAPKSSKAVAV